MDYLIHTQERAAEDVALITQLLGELVGLRTRLPDIRVKRCDLWGSADRFSKEGEAQMRGLNAEFERIEYEATQVADRIHSLIFDLTRTEVI